MLTLLAEAKGGGEYVKRIRSLIANGDRMEAQSVARAQKLLRKFHLELTRAMLEAPWETASRETMRQTFAGLLAQLGADVDSELAAFWRKGLEDYDASYFGFYKVAGMQPGFRAVGASTQVAVSAANVYAEQLVSVGTPTVQAVTNQVQRIALGAGDYQEAIRRLMALEGTDGYVPIGPFRTMRQRVEADLRTEVHRVLNVAGEIQNKQLADDIVGVKFKWVHLSKGPNARSNHAAAARAKPIGEGEKFYLGVDSQTGAAIYARFPHDPELPVGEVANCRCKKLPVMDEIDREATLARAAQAESAQKKAAKAKQAAKATAGTVDDVAQAANLKAQADALKRARRGR